MLLPFIETLIWHRFCLSHKPSPSTTANTTCTACVLLCCSWRCTACDTRDIRGSDIRLCALPGHAGERVEVVPLLQLHRHTQTHRQTHRQTQIHTETHTHTHTQTDTDTHTHRQTQTQTHRHRHRHRHRQTQTQTHRHTDTHTNTQTHTQTHNSHTRFPTQFVLLGTGRSTGFHVNLTTCKVFLSFFFVLVLSC